MVLKIEFFSSDKPPTIDVNDDAASARKQFTKGIKVPQKFSALIFPSLLKASESAHLSVPHFSAYIRTEINNFELLSGSERFIYCKFQENFVYLSSRVILLEF